ncbi:MAG TPA: DUF1893 domain-containing protein [Armatimonadaceae bacterium]|nr:DUF1893 domain-containing protein [Armatimonadaceae bacterium]
MPERDKRAADEDLKQARAERERRKLALVLVRDGRVLATGERGGVVDLLEILKRKDAASFRGASLSDRVVGKAAAMLARCGGFARVHGALMSDAAARALDDGAPRIPHSADRRVPRILNRTGDDLCPMEKLSLPHAEPQRCRRDLEAFVAKAGGPPPPPPGERR